MINVQIKDLVFKNCFFLKNLLRSHGRTCKIFNVCDQVRILFKILQELIHGTGPGISDKHLR